jgi:hypothetical protein
MWPTPSSRRASAMARLMAERLATYWGSVTLSGRTTNADSAPLNNVWRSSGRIASPSRTSAPCRASPSSRSADRPNTRTSRPSPSSRAATLAPTFPDAPISAITGPPHRPWCVILSRATNERQPGIGGISAAFLQAAGRLPDRVRVAVAPRRGSWLPAELAFRLRVGHWWRDMSCGIQVPPPRTTLIVHRLVRPS